MSDPTHDAGDTIEPLIEPAADSGSSLPLRINIRSAALTGILLLLVLHAMYMAAALLIPIPFAIYYGDGQVDCFLLSALFTFTCGGILFRRYRNRDELTQDVFVRAWERLGYPRRALALHGGHARIVRLRSDREIAAFLAQA